MGAYTQGDQLKKFNKGVICQKVIACNEKTEEENNTLKAKNFGHKNFGQNIFGQNIFGCFSKLFGIFPEKFLTNTKNHVKVHSERHRRSPIPSG